MRRTGQHVTALLLATVVALLTALSVAGAQHVSSPVHTGPTPPPPPFSGTPVLTTPTPTKGGSSFHALSAKQKKQLASVLKKDATLKKLTKGKSYKIKAESIWVTRTGSTLGGLVTLRFKKATKLKGTFIGMRYDCSEKSNPPYTRVLYKATYAPLTVMTVYIDLHRKQIAGMHPFGSLVGKSKSAAAFQRSTAGCTG